MSQREYPKQPRVGVGAVVLNGKQILLVKRKFAPNARFWTLPGGLVKLGENVQEAVQREVREECGIEVKPKKLLDVVDYIEKDENDRVKYHYVLVDFEVQHHGGTLSPSSDVLDVRWFNFNQLTNLALPEITRKFLKKHYHDISKSD